MITAECDACELTLHEYEPPEEAVAALRASGWRVAAVEDGAACICPICSSGLVCTS